MRFGNIDGLPSVANGQIMSRPLYVREVEETVRQFMETDITCTNINWQDGWQSCCLEARRAVT